MRFAQTRRCAQLSDMSLTAAERRALAGLAAIAALGAVTSLAQQWTSRAADSPASRAALRAHLVAVDSAQAVARRPRARARTRGGRVARQTSPERGTSADAGSAARQAPAQRAPVDMDTADSATLVSLPRIGPALAGRILADRSANGPFGSLTALERVRGIGPALAKALSSSVRFSGTPWPRRAQQ
jgi:competence protein ComEA